MGTDEIIRAAFQEEMESQKVREPGCGEIEEALNQCRVVPGRRQLFPLLLAAVCLGCFVLAFMVSWSFSSISMRPLAKSIVQGLPANPEEPVYSFLYSLKSGMHPGE